MLKREHQIHQKDGRDPENQEYYLSTQQVGHICPPVNQMLNCQVKPGFADGGWPGGAEIAPSVCKHCTLLHLLPLQW